VFAPIAWFTSGRRLQESPPLGSGSAHRTPAARPAGTLPVVIDWTTVADLGTAAGTLVLACATFASVRSGNRSARLAERALQIGIRPVLASSRLEDPPIKIMYGDQHWVKVEGGCAVAEVTDTAIYLAMGLRNVGAGIAVLHSWRFYPELSALVEQASDPDGFQSQTRDLYISAADVGFWQGALRDPEAPGFAAARQRIESGEPATLDLLYGDHEGGQRAVSRFSLVARPDGQWLASVVRHWNLDRDDPR